MNSSFLEFAKLFNQLLIFLGKHVVVVFSLLVLVFAFFISRRTFIFKKNAIRVEGVCIGNDQTISNDGNRMYCGLYEYIDPSDGSKRVLRTSVSTSSPQGVVGEKRWILYNKDGPIAARFDSFWELWAGQVIIIVFVLLMFVFIFFANLDF